MMNDSEEPVPREKDGDREGAILKTSLIVVGSLILLAVAAAGMAVYSTVKKAQETTFTKAGEIRRVSDARQLVLGCLSYAADEEGRFPPTLETLYPGYLDVEEIFHDEQGKPKWVYFPGLTDDPANADVPLLWSRYPVSERGYVVGYGGGKVEVKGAQPALPNLPNDGLPKVE